MTSIRICEESEARLMIRDGSFKEYVSSWCAQFPQSGVLPRIKDIYSNHGIRLSEARGMAVAMGNEEGVVLEVGSQVRIRKLNDSLTVFYLINDIWVQAEGGMDAFDSEEILSGGPTSSLTPICEENRILHAKNVHTVARSIAQFLRDGYNTKEMLFSFGKHEIWKIGEDNRIRVHSHNLNGKSVSILECEIAKHIKAYRAAQRPGFGPF